MISIDPQATGWLDDGTESGIQRVRLSHGNLVPVHFRTSNCVLQPSGTASVSLNAVNTANFDGTSTGLFCSIPGSAALGNGARIAWWFNGPVLVLRYSSHGGTLPPMSACVDGISYDIPATQGYDPITNSQFGDGPAEMQYALIADTLGTGPHFAEVFVQQTTYQSTLYLHGYMAAESAGYLPPEKGLKFGSAQITVSTSYAGIYSGNSALKAVKKLFFNNPTAGAVTVSVRSISTAANPFWVKSVAVGDTAELDMTGLSYDITTMQVVGSSAGVICSLLGAQ